MDLTSRRGFLKLAGLGAIGAAVGTRPASAETKSLTVLHESSFIPPFDEYIKTTLAEAYAKETGVKVVYEVTAVGSLPTRISTIAETGTGADITMNGLLQVIQFGEKYLDVTDLCKEVGDKNGGWYDAGREAVVVDGKWKAVPFCNIGQLMNWRADWFAEIGVKAFPDTWEELYEIGKKLKAKDHPFGFELGHGFGDNHGWLYPLLWSYGGAEVAPDGKTVVIDSDETARAVDFARKFFRDTMFEDVLGWTDVSNNKAWMAEQISCTNNAESILWFAKRNFPEIAKVTDQAQNPAGPKGRFHLLDSISHSIFNFSPVKAEAVAFMRWLMDPKQLGGWYAVAESYYQPLLHGYDNAPMWQAEPRNIPYRDAMATAHLPGWPAPASRQMAESVAKYVVVDMFAKACSGASTKDVIKNAEAQLKEIYRSA
ncbi:MAG: carbohydrate ABC transporter substrate-binding protein [Alphaproteobacteria bacterium]|nr:carbohydrate ABC transporter substrate-binding protein [Alphaproteobacteria bacterium]